MSSLSVMILCGRSPRHLYVANRLCERAHVVAIVQETGAQWSAAKVKRLAHPAKLWRKAWRWVRDRRRYRGGGEARFFFGDAPPRLRREDLLATVSHINHPDVVALADRLRPDVIAVFGTSLIRDALLTRGRLGIFNLHGGLSPRYRGADCTFWALYNGEPDQVGCTLHRIDAGIDTGALIAHVSPEVGAGDDELTLFWRSVRDSAEAYVEMLARLERGEALGVGQPEKGRLYQVKDRGWREERELAKRMRDGLLRGVALPRRVRWYTASAPTETAARDPINLKEGQTICP
jgi:methionyl-tRNA formyltransferase